MQRPALALVASLVCLVCLVCLLWGCAKTAAAPGVPILDVSVAPSRAAVLSVAPAPDPPQATPEPDGFEIGERVLVELHGTWLTATLIERRGERWLVHYDERRGATQDARDSLEELVDSERIRVPIEPIDDDMRPDDVDP